MLPKDEAEVLESPKPDAMMTMRLGQDGGEKSLDPTTNTYLTNGGSNDPPEGRG